MGRSRSLGACWRRTEVRRAECSLAAGTPRRPHGMSRLRDGPLAARLSTAGGNGLVARSHGARRPAALLDAGPVVAIDERACDECGLVSPPHTPRGPAQTRASDTCRPSISPPGSPSTAAADAAMSPWEIVRSASPFSTPAPSASIQTLRQEASPLRWLRKPFVVSRGPRPVRVPEGSAALFFPCRPDSTSPRPRASREAGPYSSQPAGTASTRPIGRRPFPRSSPASGAARISA